MTTRGESPSLLTDVTTAFSVGAMSIGMAVSFAALVFEGDLHDGIPRAALSFMVGSAVVLVVIAWRSSFDVVISGAQDTAGVVAAAIAAAIAVDAAPDQAVETTIVALAIAGFVTAFVFLLVGRMRLGETARSIPFTVISGFMAGTGWLLLHGGIEVMIDHRIHLDELDYLIPWDVAQFWIPGIVLALLLVVALDRGAPAATVGLAIVFSAVAVHVVGRIGWSAEALESNHWLIGPFAESENWAPIRPSDFSNADWGTIAGQALPLAGLATVSLIALLLSITSLEVACEDDVQVDHELDITGVANVASTAAGGLIGYHLVGYSVGADRLGARGRRVPMLIGAMFALVVLFGSDGVALMPRAVAGGILAAAGVELLIDWGRQVVRELNRLDAILSGGVLLVIMIFGVLTGIVAGILAAAILFVFSYSRITPVRQVHRLSTVHSNVDRADEERAELTKHDHQAVVLELEGYLFFGSMRKISEVLRPIVDSSELRYAILDFRGVRGLDSSVVSGFGAMERRALAADVTIIWSHLRDDLAEQLSSEGDGHHEAAPPRHREKDLDHSLAFVENQILGARSSRRISEDEARWMTALEEYGERFDLAPDQELIDISDMSGQLFAVVDGTLTAWGMTAAGERTRFLQVGPGSLLGEVSFVTGHERTATVVADTGATVIALYPSALDEMGQRDPALAIETSQRIANRLANRLAHTSQRVQKLYN
ncbi:MAG: cyclic nucleotide-binding domain-containing protein [Acidimicrobiales bacterium]|nr:cyclic nucleotide-binding domain-containing protein [Acidimicrobiales bacterium]RZV46079.1 MAG: cyclic nucleotide-binding domain-containing protein [Acidimicrobiales bacterium]